MSLKLASDTMPVILGHRGFKNLCRSVIEVLYYGDPTKVGRKRKEKTSDILEELLDDLSRRPMRSSFTWWRK